MNMKIMVGSICAAILLTLASCGASPDSLVEKQIKLFKLGKQFEHASDAAALEKANKELDKVFTSEKKSEIAKKLKENCSDDLSKLDADLDCKTAVYEMAIKNQSTQGALGEALKKCNEPKLSDKCKKSLPPAGP